MRRKLSWFFKWLGWVVAEGPKSQAVPVYRNGELIAYDEFPLNQNGEVYIDLDFGIRRTIFLFETEDCCD
jgi:hypothetical protein